MLSLFKLVLVFSLSFKVIKLVLIIKLIFIDFILFDILLLSIADFSFKEANFFIVEIDLFYSSS
jgi:hypothetical protein